MNRNSIRWLLSEQVKKCVLLLVLLPLICWFSPVQAAVRSGDWFYQESSGETGNLPVPDFDVGAMPGDSWQPLDSLEQPGFSADSQAVWMTTKLSDACPERDTLMFMTTNQAVRIWFDGTLLYEKGTFTPKDFDEGAILHMVRLPEFRGEGQLLVELYGNSQLNQGQFDMIFLDSELGQLERLYYFDIPVVLALPVALIIIFIMVIYQHFYSRGLKRLYGFIIFFMTVFSFWLLSASYLKFMLLDNPVFWWYSISILAYLLPLSSNLILYELLRDKPYAHMGWVVGGNVLLFAAAMIGELAGIHAMNGLMMLYYPMVGIGDTIAMIWSIRAAWQGDRLCRAVLVPTFAFTVLGVFDGLAGHFHILPWRTFMTPLAVYGFAVFVIEIMREQLRRGQMLEVKTAGLEQKAALALQRSDTDKLTGCLNRNRLKTLLLNGITRAQLSGGGLALLMLDIDHFKQINDTYGHEVGDDVLIGFSRVIRGQLDKYKSCVRWGGEEFMILADEGEAGKVMELAETIRQQVAQAEFSGHRITCSIGVAIWQGAKDTPGAFFKRVDTALYQAKNSGRNCVCLAEEEKE